MSTPETESLQAAPVVTPDKGTDNSYEVGYTDADPIGPNPVQKEESLLAGKFKSAEELEKAYKELESKLGKSSDTPDDSALPTADDNTPKVAAVENTKEAADMLTGKGLDISTFTREYETQGQLSEESYTALATKGISKDMVDAYINGQRVLLDSQINEVKQDVGGEVNYNKILAWAATGLTDKEKESYNTILATNDLGIIKLAAQGLKARYDAVVGKDPAVVVGGSAPAAGNDGLERFASRAQMVEAMRDPRYEKDPAYRAKVERKTINSYF